MKKGIEESGISRNNIFIVTKLRTQDHGSDQCKKAFQKSLRL